MIRIHTFSVKMELVPVTAYVELAAMLALHDHQAKQAARSVC